MVMQKYVRRLDSETFESCINLRFFELNRNGHQYAYGDLFLLVEINSLGVRTRRTFGGELVAMDCDTVELRNNLLCCDRDKVCES